MVFLHGFLGCPDDWKPVTDLLSSALPSPHKKLSYYRLPAHGRPALQKKMSLEALAQDFEDDLKLQGIHPDRVVGYSMGGRIALRWAIDHQPKKLVLIGASPGLSVAERPIRKQQDLEWANLLRANPDQFLQMWEKQPLFGPPRPQRYSIMSRSVSDPIGLQRIFLEASQAENTDLWHRLPQYKGELSYLVGAFDVKYVELARRIVDVRPSTKVIRIPNCYHDPHRTNPTAVAEILRSI